MLGLASAGMFSLLAPQLAVAQAWRQLDAAVRRVGDAPVLNDGLQLTLPLVADDGSSVPFTVSAGKPGGSHIQQLAIYAPANPTPDVAVFTFGPEIETVNLTTRIRLSESQTVIVVAHTEDGRALVAERDVRVTTSGCIAPAQSDPANEMNARVRVPKTWKGGAPAEVLTMISHPMVTGLVQDAKGDTPPSRIIERFEATLDGRPVLSARYFRSLAANPYLKFDLSLRQEGELRFKWVEDTGRSVHHNERVRLA